MRAERGRRILARGAAAAVSSAGFPRRPPSRRRHPRPYRREPRTRLETSSGRDASALSEIGGSGDRKCTAGRLESVLVLVFFLFIFLLSTFGNVRPEMRSTFSTGASFETERGTARAPGASVNVSRPRGRNRPPAVRPGASFRTDTFRKRPAATAVADANDPKTVDTERVDGSRVVTT